MALIECPECKGSISDECRRCPKCGYKIKKIQKQNSINVLKSIPAVFKENKQYSILKGKFLISAIRVLALVCVVFSFILIFAGTTYTRNTYRTTSSIATQILAKSLIDFTFDYAIVLGILIIVFGAISILAIILNDSITKKFKINQKILFIPNIIYAVLTLVTIILGYVVKIDFAKGFVKYKPVFGAYYIYILALLSCVLLIWDYKLLLDI